MRLFSVVKAGCAPTLLSMTAVACAGAIEPAPPGEREAPRSSPGEPPAGEPPASVADPGVVVIRRLNRTEYNNTVRDLIGTTLRPADAFPPDDTSYGFDNIAKVLSVSPLLSEMHLRAAEALVTDALAQPAARQRLFICDLGAGDGMACGRKILSAFARRAWRRPPGDEQVTALTALFAASLAGGGGATADRERAMRVALTGVLASARFLFRAELDPDPTVAAPHPLDDHDLATRLSYWLWSSMPDEALFAAADEGRLRTEVEVIATVERMLDDAKAKAFVDNFAGQWLHTRNLAATQPDRRLFPRFDDALRSSMRTETQLFFAELLAKPLPIGALLTADFSFANERLAAHYGLPAPGKEFAKVSLAAKPRRGLLGQASVLTVTSFPTRTSVVARGAWVLEQLLCQPPPDPPATVSALPEGAAASGSLRQRLEAHRANPTCAACHKLMDPIGFALEGFDAIGAERATDNGVPIDTRGELLEGPSFDGAVELGAVLARDRRLRRCLAEKLSTFALGRGPDGPAAAQIDETVSRFEHSDGSLRSLLRVFATSRAFRYRRPERAEEARP